MPVFLSTFLGNLGELANWVTAFSTSVLAILTFVLVLATFRMAKAMATPQVIANIEVNQWSILHMDIVVENCGNAPAYNVNVEISPPIRRKETYKDQPFPFTNISLLRPGQRISSFATDYSSLEGKSLKVKICWRKNPTRKRIET